MAGAEPEVFVDDLCKDRASHQDDRLQPQLHFNALTFSDAQPLIKALH